MLNKFITSRETDWKRLETLLARLNMRQKLEAAEIYELGRLYRMISSDLAIAQRDYQGQPVTVFLNQLLLRAHSFIYQNDVTRLGGLWIMIAHTIPQAFRQMARFTAIAFLLFMIPAGIGYRIALVNPSVAQALGLEEQRQVLAEHNTWTDIPPEDRPSASTFIITNNIRIALLAFAGGITFGLFSAYILLFNGLIIGAVVGLAAHYNMASDLLAFMVGHGFLELSIIFMAGGAGLSLGWALLNPKNYTRLDALRLQAQRSVYLAILAIPILIIAGIIEGFISPSALPSLIRLGIGVVTGTVLYLYLWFGGRASPEQKAVNSSKTERPTAF